MDTVVFVDEASIVDQKFCQLVRSDGYQLVCAENRRSVFECLERYDVGVVMVAQGIRDNKLRGILSDVSQKYPDVARMTLCTDSFKYEDIEEFDESLHEDHSGYERIRRKLRAAYDHYKVRSKAGMAQRVMGENGFGYAVVERDSVISEVCESFLLSLNLEGHQAVGRNFCQLIFESTGFVVPQVDEWFDQVIELPVDMGLKDNIIFLTFSMKVVEGSNSKDTTYSLLVSRNRCPSNLLLRSIKPAPIEYISGVCDRTALKEKYKFIAAMAKRYKWAVGLIAIRVGGDESHSVVNGFSAYLDCLMRETDAVCLYQENLIVVLLSRIESDDCIRIVKERVASVAMERYSNDRKPGGVSIEVGASIGNGEEDFCSLLRNAVSDVKDADEVEREKIAVASQAAEYSSADTELKAFHGMLSSSPLMHSLFEKVWRMRLHETSIFICGETGTGKELLARAIHQEGARKEAPFVAVNCANLSEQLLESQLFGHKKGAFTGAVKDQEGIFAAADGGTLFLDEVTELPLSLQAKLLRVLQEREYIPVGDTKPRKFDVQLLSASSTRLSEAVSNGEFRLDLQYRIEVIPLELRPLRDRGLDAVLLFERFVRAGYAERHGEISDEGVMIDDDVLRAINDYSWPGNIRELKNVCDYVLAMSHGTHISLDVLPDKFTPQKDNEIKADDKSGGKAIILNPALDKERLVTALSMHNGNRTDTADYLGVSRMTLWRKMKIHNIAG